MTTVLAFVLFAAVAFGIGYLVHIEAKKRRDALAALASDLGAAFAPEKDRGHDERYRQFDLFRSGSGRVAYNTIRGTTDVGSWRAAFVMGDYQYTVQQGKHSHTYQVSYLLLDLPFGRVPDILVRRENLLDRVAGTIGFDDIDFESAEFSSRFYVQSSDKRFAYDVFHPRMMEFLMQVDPPPIQLASGTLLLHRGTQRWGPDDFRAHLTWAREFLGRWPDHVVASLRT
jgi:hypothetical protein